MIDTIKFKIPISPEIYEAIKLKSKETTRVDNETGLTEIKTYYKDAELGSYDYKVNLSLYEEDCMYLEFSAAKAFYGHNVFLLYPPLDSVLIFVQDVLQKFYEISIPHYSTWILQRLDICYAYKFKSHEEAYTALILLGSFDMSRKNKNIWDTSFELKGTTYTLRGYLKFEEYKKHDFKRLRTKNLSLAYDILHESECVLRVELELKKKKLMTLFRKEITYKEINETSVLVKILNDHMSVLLHKADTKVMHNQEALLKLLHMYKKQKAMNLYSFYNTWNNPNNTQRTLNRRAYKKLNPSTLWRKHRDLSLAGVGIPNDTCFTNIDFKIPSDFVVNKENIVTPVCSKQLGLLMDS